MRLIFFTFSILVLLFVGAIVGPSFVDWNKYKPQIIEQVKNATDLDVTIGGDLSLAIIPSPRVKIEEMVVVAPSPVNFENLLTMKSAEVSVELMPLLKKQVKVKSVTLIAPDIQAEIGGNGKPSWETDKMAKIKQATDVAPSEVKQETTKVASKVLDSIALDEVEIKDGKLIFVNHQTGVTHSASNIDIELEADSLNGPFEVKGGLIYQDKKITIDGKTGKLPKGDEGLPVNAKVALPDADTSLDFKGVVAISAPYEVQGQTNLKIGSASKLKAVTGISLGDYNKSLGMEGLLTANENKMSFDNLKLSLGEFIGNGKISVQNLKTQNPLIVTGNIKSSSVLNLNDFMASNKKTAAGRIGFTKTAHATNAKALVPQTLTLPMLIDANVKLDLGGVKVQKYLIKGVFLDVNKTGKTTKTTFKVLELPGQGKANGSLNIDYAAASQSTKTGAVTYSDPSVSYAVNGQTNQLATFLKAFAPDADTSAVTKLYKTAQFNLKGAINGNVISLKDSTLKLDEMVAGLGGRYQPAVAGGRAKATIDVSAGSVDFDRIMQAQGDGKSAPSKDAGTPKSTKEALKPIQGFSLPLDLIFDVSLQKARINKADLNGLRLAGDLVGKKLNLKTASVNNFAGAVISLKGQVANLSDLSGLDLNLYTKTNNIGQLARAFKVDTSKLPANLDALEANVAGKGNMNQLNFNTTMKALGGQLDASGVAKDLLGTPSYSDLSLGLKHPNLVKAIQIVNPSFKGQAGLNQAVNLSTKANINGKQYDLSDMKVALGATSFGGNLKINAGSTPMSIRGNIAAGKIALDSLLGAKGASGSSANASGGSSASSKSGDRWSKSPIDLSWMKTLDLDVDLSASSLTYGAWNFTNPSTDLKIADGQMNVNGMKAGVFGGQATLTTQVNAAPVSLSLSSAMNNIDLEKLARALSGGNKLKASGTVDFDVNASGTGASSHALINALNGKANLNGTNVILKGFDLAKLARGLATEEKLIVSARSLVDGAMSGGQTKFDTVKGDYNIEKGKVIIQSMVMDSVEAVINSTGYADLPSWFINVDNVITLKNVKDLEPFTLKVKGPLNNPSDTFGKNILEDYITDKIKRKIGKELPDILGDDVSDKLKEFGIIPQDKAPTPATEAAPAPTGDVAPAEPAQQVAPEPAPVEKKKIEKPEDALEQILQNPDNPEEALKGVLEGLF